MFQQQNPSKVVGENKMIHSELPRRKTKIIATIGPASNSPEKIRELIHSGMNIVRLNFSHGTHEEHSQIISLVREEAKRAGVIVAVFQDLCGPKVRIGPVQNGEIQLEGGNKISLKQTNGDEGSPSVLFVEAFNPCEVMKIGDKAYLADGQIELIAEKVTKDEVICSIRAGGPLRSRSGIAVPDSKLNLPCITEKDLVDLKWAVREAADYVALSFVRSAKDILQLREELLKLGRAIPVIAKIERAVALDHIEEIIEASDALMIARGDLGLELPLERVPGAQKFITEKANFWGKPVITATQMLRSMIKELRPTRAEVTDVCTAVRDGTDAVMLSDETAIGKNPVQAVKVLDRIVQEAEREFIDESSKVFTRSQDWSTVPDAICFAASNAATKINASAIIVCTDTGHTGRLMAKYRPRQPLFAATTEPEVMARLVLHWGVEPVLIELAEDAQSEDEITQSLLALREQYGLKPGSRVVVTAGLRTKRTGTTNVMQIREIPRGS
jgi:pyruvate kinase